MQRAIKNGTVGDRLFCLRALLKGAGSRLELRSPHGDCEGGRGLALRPHLEDGVRAHSLRVRRPSEPPQHGGRENGRPRAAWCRVHVRLALAPGATTLHNAGPKTRGTLVLGSRPPRLPAGRGLASPSVTRAAAEQRPSSRIRAVTTRASACSLCGGFKPSSSRGGSAETPHGAAHPAGVTREAKAEGRVGGGGRALPAPRPPEAEGDLVKS